MAIQKNAVNAVAGQNSMAAAMAAAQKRGIAAPKAEKKTAAQDSSSVSGCCSVC